MSKRSIELRCDVCGRKFTIQNIVPAAFVRSPVTDLIRQVQPSWGEQSYICYADLNRFRSEYVQRSLEEERGELSELEQQVVQSLLEQELLAENLNAEFEQRITIAERVADTVAQGGGSWKFIIGFGAVLVSWIAINSVGLIRSPFDPYPYILLNLVLSCLAAVQAPIIMMSQNRQEQKDRLRAEHDYRVDLKAELEIRHLHSKLDMLLTHQWQRLLEIQQLQVDLMEELGNARHKPTGPPP